MYVGPWQEYRLAKLHSDAVNELKEQFRHLQFSTGEGGVGPNGEPPQLDTQRCVEVVQGGTRGRGERRRGVCVCVCGGVLGAVRLAGGVARMH